MMIEETKSKYKNKKVTYNGIKFDSQMECDFYIFLLQSHPSDTIEIQPIFELQPKFEKNGKLYRATKYIADFRVGALVFDCKGMTTPDFAIKRKMFEYKFADLHLSVITKCPLWLQNVHGKWIELDDLVKARTAKNKLKKVKK